MVTTESMDKPFRPSPEETGRARAARKARRSKKKDSRTYKLATTQVAALRVKIKSLAAEAVIIRAEERRALARGDAALYLSLYGHRRHEERAGVRSDVRAESRSALLAYAFIRGRDYAGCERPAKTNPPDTKRLSQLVEKFGSSPGLPYKLGPNTLVAWMIGLLPHPFEAEPERGVVAEMV